MKDCFLFVTIDNAADLSSDMKKKKALQSLTSLSILDSTNKKLFIQRQRGSQTLLSINSLVTVGKLLQGQIVNIYVYSDRSYLRINLTLNLGLNLCGYINLETILGAY